MKSLGIGVIGAGDVALKLYLPVINDIDPSRAWLAALADVDEERARRAQAKFGGRRMFSDYRDLLACPDVDVVVNLTRHKAHAEINLAALDAGKHVYSEKPMATTLDEANRIVEKAASAGLALAAAPAIVLNPQVTFTKQLYAEGRLGRMCFARVHGSHEGGTLHGHYYDWPGTICVQKVAGRSSIPAFMPCTPSPASLGQPSASSRSQASASLSVTSPPCGRRVSSPTRSPPDVDDNVLIMLDWGDGMFGHVDASHCMLASQGPWAEFYGSKGVVVAGRGKRRATRASRCFKSIRSLWTSGGAAGSNPIPTAARSAGTSAMACPRSSRRSTLASGPPTAANTLGMSSRSSRSGRVRPRPVGSASSRRPSEPDDT